MAEGLTLDQFWRCPVCNFGFGMGAPGVVSVPPRCAQHGEMEQTTADGFAADINNLREED